MRVLLMNLGDNDATNVKVHLRNPKDKGGGTFAQGTVNVPGKSISIASLPVIARWQVWKRWEIEVDGGENEVLIYPRVKE